MISVVHSQLSKTLTTSYTMRVLNTRCYRCDWRMEHITTFYKKSSIWKILKNRLAAPNFSLCCFFFASADKELVKKHSILVSFNHKIFLWLMRWAMCAFLTSKHKLNLFSTESHNFSSMYDRFNRKFNIVYEPRM